MLTSTIETGRRRLRLITLVSEAIFFEYDQVMNEQREIMYAERARVLDGENMRNAIMKMIN